MTDLSTINLFSQESILQYYQVDQGSRLKSQSETAAKDFEKLLGKYLLEGVKLSSLADVDGTNDQGGATNILLDQVWRTWLVDNVFSTKLPSEAKE